MKLFKTQKSRIKSALLFLFIITLLLIIILIFWPEKERIEKQETSKEYPEDTAGQRDSGLVGTSIPEKTEPIPVDKWIAIVIDDAGYNLEELKPFLDFPAPLTIAVLPRLDYSTQASRMIHEAGKEVLLHQPMQSIHDIDPGPGAIFMDMDEEQIIAILEQNFASVPHAHGMNNHMGSKVMADRNIMEIVMRYLDSNNKFFLDSKTDVNSIGRKIAMDMGVCSLERNVFLDNNSDFNYIKSELQKGLEIAEQRGAAVFIGHVQNHQPIIQVLSNMYPRMRTQGYKLVTVTELIGKLEDVHR